MTTTTKPRPAVRLLVRLAPYAGHRLRHRLEVVSPVLGTLCGDWHDSRRAALRAGREWARDRGYRVEKES